MERAAARESAKAAAAESESERCPSNQRRAQRPAEGTAQVRHLLKPSRSTTPSCSSDPPLQPQRGSPRTTARSDATAASAPGARKTRGQVDDEPLGWPVRAWLRLHHSR